MLYFWSFGGVFGLHQRVHFDQWQLSPVHFSYEWMRPLLTLIYMFNLPSGLLPQHHFSALPTLLHYFWLFALPFLPLMQPMQQVVLPYQRHLSLLLLFPSRLCALLIFICVFVLCGHSYFIGWTMFGDSQRAATGRIRLVIVFCVQIRECYCAFAYAVEKERNI